MKNNFAKERNKISTCSNRIWHITCARHAQRHVRTYVTEKCDTPLYTNIRLSTNNQLIFLPSAERGVDKKLWQVPEPQIKGVEGKPEFFRLLFYFQLCIDRFFIQLQRNSTVSNQTVGRRRQYLLPTPYITDNDGGQDLGGRTTCHLGGGWPTPHLGSGT